MCGAAHDHGRGRRCGVPASSSPAALPCTPGPPGTSATARQLSWLDTRIKVAAPQALIGAR
ncbi:hypothetical protein L083_5600 [Actinoplanes sp. N902-109]|nr:hypothetical protein L083_5600 [Actinoplanes sp. N902-109]